MGYFSALFEDAPGFGIFVEFIMGAAQHPVGDGVIRLVLDRVLEVIPGLPVASLLEELAAERVEDHGVSRVPLEQLAEHVRSGSFHTTFLARERGSGAHPNGHWFRLEGPQGSTTAGYREENEMQLSTRNRLPGTITEVVKGEAAAKVTLQVGDNHLVALITRESADELGLEPGKQATALVKATDVMILTEGGDLA